MSGTPLLAVQPSRSGQPSSSAWNTPSLEMSHGSRSGASQVWQALVSWAQASVHVASPQVKAGSSAVHGLPGPSQASPGPTTPSPQPAPSVETSLDSSLDSSLE